MQDLTFSSNGESGGSWKRHSALRVFVTMGVFAAGLHFSALGHESGPSDTALRSKQRPQRSAPEANLDFQATAYCDPGITKSGAPTSPGVVAADPRVLPLGSVIHVNVPRYRGVYEVMDTGRLVKGRIIDIYIPDYDLAIEFGRRNVKVRILRYGFSGPYLNLSSN